MRKFILFLLVFTSSYNVFSQHDSLLKIFKYRIDKFRAINLNANGGSQYSKNEFATGINKNSSSAGVFGANFNTVKSTDKILLTTSGAISSYFNSGKSENITSVNKSRSFSVGAQYSILNKWFAKKMFTELGAGVSGNNYSYKDISTTLLTTLRNKQTDYSITLNTGIGKGRLEIITDIQNALWLNKALEEAGRLSKALSSDELYELGLSITKANNTRVLDGRKRTQFALETVDNYLQQKGLISKNDIAYFSNLNDILFFAFNNYRLAGKERFIRLSPALSGVSRDRTQNDIIDKYEQRSKIKSALLSIGFNNYKPVNLKHQNNYGASVKLNYISYKSTDRYFSSGVLVNEFNGNTTIKQAGINLFYQHSLYPNTRTIINLTLQTEGGYQDADKEDSFYSTTNLSGNFNYFISYRTRLTFDIGTTYSKNIYTAYQNLQFQPDNMQLFVNAGIGISL
jgi:hypothetical protein